MAIYKSLANKSGHIGTIESTDTLATGIVSNGSAVTTVPGGTSGNLYWSQPEQGSAHKKVVIVLAAYNDAIGAVITFPVAFTTIPALTNGTSLATPTFSTTTITIPATSSITGTLVLTGM